MAFLPSNIGMQPNSGGHGTIKGADCKNGRIPANSANFVVYANNAAGDPISRITPTSCHIGMPEIKNLDVLRLTHSCPYASAEASINRRS